MNINCLHDPQFRTPSIFQQLKARYLGEQTLFDCIQVEVSSACMGKCDYCPQTLEKELWHKALMQPEVFAALWQAMLASRRVHLQGWGEPLLHPNFFDFAAFARKAQCQVSTTTCGITIHEEKALKIVKSGIDILAFSLTGTDSTSNSNRKNLDFDKVCESIELLQFVRKKNMAVHLEIHCAYLLLKSKLSAITALPKLMHKLGVHAIVVSTLDYMSAPYKENLLQEAFLPEDIKAVEEARMYLQEAKKEATSLGIDMHFALPQQNMLAQCREEIQRTFSVSVTGDIAPCVYLNVPTQSEKPYIFGNVLDSMGENNKDTVLRVWEKEEFVKFRLAQKECKPYTVCKTCPKYYEL